MQGTERSFEKNGCPTLVFIDRLKSNGLENLTDQRLTEVTFGVTINV